MDRNFSEEIRKFNRFYSGAIGLFDFYSIHPTLTDVECRILYEIMDHEKITAKELSDIIHIDRGYLSRTLAKLEKNGYIVRHESEIDRRYKNLELTEKGKEARRLCIENANKNTDIQFGQLSREELEKIIGAMRLIQDIFTSKQGNP